VKRVLVTGAAGFVGTHLAAAGERHRWTVTAVDLRPVLMGGVEALQLDAGDNKLLTRVGRGEFDAVLQQAAISDTLDDRRHALTETNVVVSLALARACARSGTRFVFASSGSVYGTVLRFEPVPEGAVGDVSWCTGPLNEYARSKLLLETQMGQLQEDLPWVGLRYTNVFGPGEQHKGRMASIISQMLRHAARGEPIRVFRDTLSACRDYLPVSLLVDTVAAIVEGSVPSGVYNLGSGHAISFAELLQWCAAFRGDDPTEVRLVPNPVASRYQRWTCADMGRLRSVLPGVPQISRDQVRDAAHVLYRSFLPARRPS
jgi:nucleoside-diphosphate-sugar epimerase